MHAPVENDRESSGKRGMPGEHGKEGCPERIDVGSRVHIQLVDLFRAGIIWGSQKSAHRERRPARGPGNRFCQAKIHELCSHLPVPVIEEHDVRGLDIAVNKPRTMQRVQGAADLDRKLQSI